MGGLLIIILSVNRKIFILLKFFFEESWVFFESGWRIKKDFLFLDNLLLLFFNEFLSLGLLRFLRNVSLWIGGTYTCMLLFLLILLINLYFSNIIITIFNIIKIDNIVNFSWIFINSSFLMINIFYIKNLCFVRLTLRNVFLI